MLFLVSSFLFGLAAVALLVLWQSKYPAIKGRFAEELVYRELLNLPDEYHIFNDLFFESNGRSTQIDHVVVSPYGVFVIETKGYRGGIIGDESTKYWTQAICWYKSRFYNPVLQNEGHARCVRHLLKPLGDIPIIPLVVFDNEAALKVGVRQRIVINRRELAATIMTYREATISEETRQMVIKTLNDNLVYADKEKMAEHIRSVQAKACEAGSRPQWGICPKCGSKLVRRNGPYGNFLGCSNYPLCRYTAGGIECSLSDKEETI